MSVNSVSQNFNRPEPEDHSLSTVVPYGSHNCSKQFSRFIIKGDLVGMIENPTRSGIDTLYLFVCPDCGHYYIEVSK